MYRWEKREGKWTGEKLGAYLCYMSGVYGILVAATLLGKLKYEEIIVSLILFVVASGLWSWRYLVKRSSLWSWVLVSSIAIGTIWVEREFLLDLLERLQKGEAALAHLTKKQESIFTVYFMAFGALLLYEITFRVKLSFLSAFAIFGAIGAQIYLKRDVPMYEIGLLLFYQSTSMIIHHQRWVEKHSGESGVERKDGVRGLILMESVIVCLFLIGAGLARSSLQTDFFQFPLQVEHFISKGLPDLFWINEEDGVINRGELRGKDRKRLEITSSEKPENVFYVKGFTGSTYTGDGWEAANDRIFYESQVGKREFSMWGVDEIAQYYEESTFQTTSDLLRKIDIHPLQISVKEIDGDHRYSPYLSREIEEKDTTFLYETYPQNWIENLVYYTEIQPPFPWQESEDDNYLNYILDTYTKLPDSGLNRIRQLCETHPAQERDKVTLQIQNMLWENADYTIDPGEIPEGEDVAEYFLFERKAGYCQHFATAAVLMYRMYGIPSRYATGFLVSPEDFIQEEDGKWKAVIKGEKAHAWAEIYIDNLGWIPVETTPPGSVTGIEVVESGGMEERTEAFLEEETSETSEETKESERPTEKNSVNKVTLEEVENTNNQYIGEDSSLQDFLIFLVKGVIILGGILALAALGARGILKYRRRGVEKNSKSSASRLLRRIVEMMHMIGQMRGYRGDEERFSQVLSEVIPNLSEEEIKRLVCMAMQENFGKENVSKEELRQAYTTYRKIAEFVYGRIGPIRRIYFEYIKVYG